MTAGSEEGAYFRSIEETFIRLRGTPFLLSPADWQVARKWQRMGVPVEQVCRSLERFFDRRLQRGASQKVQSLRYCASAVESDWKELQELAAPSRRVEAPPLSVPERLERLAGALPRSASNAAFEEARGALRELAAGSQQAAPAVEERLEEIERLLFEALDRAQGESDRTALEEGVRARLEDLEGRLPPTALAEAGERLRREALRRRHSLPVLSLFSPEARGESAG